MQKDGEKERKRTITQRTSRKTKKSLLRQQRHLGGNEARDTSESYMVWLVCCSQLESFFVTGDPGAAACHVSK